MERIFANGMHRYQSASAASPTPALCSTEPPRHACQPAPELDVIPSPAAYGHGGLSVADNGPVRHRVVGASCTPSPARVYGAGDPGHTVAHWHCRGTGTHGPLASVCRHSGGGGLQPLLARHRPHCQRTGNLRRVLQHLGATWVPAPPRHPATDAPDVSTRDQDKTHAARSSFQGRGRGGRATDCRNQHGALHRRCWCC